MPEDIIDAQDAMVALTEALDHAAQREEFIARQAMIIASLRRRLAEAEAKPKRRQAKQTADKT